MHVGAAPVYSDNNAAVCSGSAPIYADSADISAGSTAFNGDSTAINGDCADISACNAAINGVWLRRKRRGCRTPPMPYMTSRLRIRPGPLDPRP
eukprot:3274368-Rhodomonas_salina.1